MPKNNWIGGAGVQDWSDVTQWSLGAAPVTGDDVFILQGSSDIQAGLAQSAVSIKTLTIGPGFNGTIGLPGVAPTYLAIGIQTTNNVIIDTASPLILIDFGTTTPQVNVLATGQPSANSLGSEAFRFQGGGAGTNLYCAGNSSVGVATEVPGQTSTLDSWNTAGGILNMGAGVTWTNGYQRGASTVTTNSAGSLVSQSSVTPALITQGAGKVTTMNITGTATISNRPASGTDAFATLSIGPGATVTFAGDPRPFTITNPIMMANQAILTAFSPTQVQMAGATPLQIKTQLCSISDVTLNLGAPILATITNY